MNKLIHHPTLKTFYILVAILLLATACGENNFVDENPFDWPNELNDEPDVSSNELDDESLSDESAEAGDAADLVLHNGAIYTVNENQPWAEAIAIKDGVISYVGDDVGVERFIGEETQVVDLDGNMVMPGFQDPHLHVLEAGVNENLCLVPEFGDPREYIDHVRDCAEDQRGKDWVFAAGADMRYLLEFSRLPIDILDEAVPDRPVLVLDNLGHGAWLNSLAMEAVGYDGLEDDPAGGIIVYNSFTGEPTGIVLENAQQVVRNAVFPPTEANLDLAYEGLLTALETLAENGITTVSDAGGYWTRGHHEVWYRAEEEGELTVRASNALYVYPDLPFDDQLAELAELHTNDPDSLVRFDQAKIYVDGILDLGTSALHEPYLEGFGIPNLALDGFLYFSPDVLDQYAVELDAAGFQLHFHVTGDRATHLALNAIESASEANNTDRRHRLTHLYLVDRADFPRFNELNVIADYQLATSSTDPSYLDYLYDHIGERFDDYLPAFAMFDVGIHVVISSDWDADDLSPFAKIESILSSDAPNTPDLATTIRMMTLDVAYLLHQEDVTGSIEVGKLADLIILDSNLFDVRPNQIGNVAVLATFLEGEVVYQSPFGVRID